LDNPLFRSSISKEERQLRRFRVAISLAAVAVVVASTGLMGSSQAAQGRFGGFGSAPGRPSLSGVADPSFLTGTEGVQGTVRVPRIEQVPSDDIQTNADDKADASDQFGSGEGTPANETSIAVNPTDPSNVIGGANDYESGVDSVMGIYTSFDGGLTWPWSRHARQIITPSRKMLGSGDPVIAFDSEGVAYASFIAFGRDDCDSYIAVVRSYDKGVTWTVPVDDSPPGSEYLDGDGIAVHNGGPEDCDIFHDKEWMVAGVRPEEVPLVPGTDMDNLSPDRLYVTWTRFSNFDSPIFVTYSDDQGRHWSDPAEISGANAQFCQTQFGDNDPPACDEDQFSVPVVDPTDGSVHVAFENGNQPCCRFNQFMHVSSTDGGQTWTPPVRIVRVQDGPATYPICAGRQTLDDMCARVNSAGNIELDPTTGDLYYVWSDNRNGSAADTNTDVFLRRSTNGGATWAAVAQITSDETDQFFPWMSINNNGVIAITYFDRQYTYPLIDTSLAVSSNGGASFTQSRVSEESWDPNLAFRLGVFIGDYNGIDTSDTTAIPFWTDARFAEPNVAGNNPAHQQSDVMVDVEPLPAP
jgi:hypothetical protein